MKLKILKSSIQMHVPTRGSLAPARVLRIRGHKLMQINDRMFRNNPLCVRCKPKGLVSVVTQWDHKVPLYAGGSDTEDNKQGLCTSCHLAKTNEDRLTYGGTVAGAGVAR